MSSVPKWGGRRAQTWSAAVLARYGTRCHLAFPDVCTGVATTGDHVVPRSVDVSLQYDVDNGRPACLACNIHRKARPLARVVVVDGRSFFESGAPRGKDPYRSPPRQPRKTAPEPEGDRP